MAASATVRGATSHFSPQYHLLHSTNNPAVSLTFVVLLPKVISKPIRRRLLVVRRSGGDVSAETTTSETTESEAPVDVRKEPSSLISALNVEKALRGIAITDVDHYGRLGLRRGCSYDQVSFAYKKKVEELTNQGLEEDELNKNLELLKESYSILSSVEERRLYDWSLSRSENPEDYKWPFEMDITQTPPDESPPQEEEDVGPTRLVGYLILGWLILSFTLSIALNR
ncbi:hypothetical protein M9H77_19477 [Catharanthus roseus]|uniref:Uncharacterized protein n=1 Tax=Catharanthus roseus TaxID=4058 RepID=A0ACC0BAH3_CATRO|nr:hypothetical protein M9H77_19477 [Catharanthus roseus]